MLYITKSILAVCPQHATISETHNEDGLHSNILRYENK